MKTRYIFILLLIIAVFTFSACEKDNYDPPTTEFVGKLTYNGKNMPWNGNTQTSSEAEIIQLYQDGFGKYAPINVRVADDGTFRALLFNGEYKMIMKDQKYPFVFDEWPVNDKGKLDTIKFNLNGRKEVDIKVTPYYEINDISSTIDGTKIATTFNLKQIVSGAKVTAVYVYMHVNVNVNRGTPLNQKVENVDVTKPITVKLPISGYRSKYINNNRDYGYIRVAVQLEGANEYLWSEVMRVEDIPVTLDDITKEYIKNPGPAFVRVDADKREGDIISTPKDWIVTDPIKQTTSEFGGYGGLELRWGRNAIGAAKFNAGDINNGKIYQTFKLPAGSYEFGFGFNGFSETWNGKTNEAFIVVAKGNSIPDFNVFKTSSLAYADWNAFKESSVAFTLTEETTISVGFLFNILGATEGRPGVAYFVPSVQLIRTE